MKTILLTALAVSSMAFSEEGWYEESFFDHWHQTIAIDKLLYREKTDLQDLIIFENKLLGRVLALDGIVQLTERDEPIYHEMIVHVPLFAHGQAEQVLIIGGGDGGALREVLRHQEVKKVVLVEIDPSVIMLARQMFPNVSRGAFDDPRVEIVIADGAEYVKNTEERFDVVICDSTDPYGPGAVLFSEAFYGNCKRVLNSRGIFVNQNGVPFIQDSEIALTYSNRASHFSDVSFYVAPVPTYCGGFMAFGWASDCPDYRTLNLAELQRRFGELSTDFFYYTPEIHQAAFALPRFILNQIPKSNIK